MNVQALNQLPGLNDLDRQVVAAIGDGADLLDAYGYPARSAVKRIAQVMGRNAADDDLMDIYYSLKYLLTLYSTRPLTPSYSPERITMSNSPSNKAQNVNIELSPNQLSPRDCLPTDFEIGSPTQTAQTPGHGQRGDSKAEEAKIFAETDSHRPTQPVTAPNKQANQ